MISQGFLVECENGKLYHVIFVPPVWRAKYVSDDANFIHLRNKCLEWIKGSIPEFSRISVEGFVFYNSDSTNYLIDIDKYVNCYFEKGIVLPISKMNLHLKECYLGGSLDCVESHTAVLSIRLDGVGILGSLRPKADPGILNLSISKSCIMECLRLSEVEIGGLSILGSAIGSIVLENCHIKDKVIISNVQAPNGAVFDSSDFEDHFSISRSKLPRTLRFLDCDFADRVVFRDIDWPSGMVSSSYTTGSRFRELVTFTSSQTPPIQLFDGGTFEANISFASTYSGRWNDAFLSELNSKNSDESQVSFLASRIEAGCRNLRNLAQDRGDGPMEHFWHRAEIIARRKTTNISCLERLASDAYGLFADYGLSIGRPFVWLTILWFAMSLLYAYTGGENWVGPINWRSVVQGMAYGLHQTFPLSVFNDPDPKWLESVLGKSHSIENLGLRFLATLQTVLSAVLIYLGVMAIRRKFKIG